MCNYTYPTVCLVIIVVSLTYHLKQCPSCYKGLTEDSFDSYDDVDKLYPGVFVSESELGLEDCDQVCFNETRCLRRCNSTVCSTHCGIEEGSRWKCPHQTLPNVTYLSNQTFPNGTNSMETGYNFEESYGRARRSAHICPGGGTPVGSGPCITCIYMYTPITVLNPAGDTPPRLHMIQLTWAAEQPAKFQVVYEGNCSSTAPAICTVHSRPIKALVSKPTRISEIADFSSIDHGFETIYINSHCAPYFVL